MEGDEQRNSRIQQLHPIYNHLNQQLRPSLPMPDVTMPQFSLPYNSARLQQGGGTNNEVDFDMLAKYLFEIPFASTGVPPEMMYSSMDPGMQQYNMGMIPSNTHMMAPLAVPIPQRPMSLGMEDPLDQPVYQPINLAGSGLQMAAHRGGLGTVTLGPPMMASQLLAQQQQHLLGQQQGSTSIYGAVGAQRNVELPFGGESSVPVPSVPITSAGGVAAAAASEQTAGSKRRRLKADPEAKKAHALEQAVRRKERNRLLAVRTRLRKKFFLESLQRQMMDLRKTNQNLKAILTKKMGEAAASKILQSCAVEHSLLAIEGQEATANLEYSDFQLMHSLQVAQQIFIVTDPYLPDNPIVFASQGFSNLTGYGQQQCVGRNCRFLQGEQTEQASIDAIRDGLAKGVDTSIGILNYKADGTPFYNNLFIAALKDSNGKIVNFVGVICPSGADHIVKEKKGKSAK